MAANNLFAFTVCLLPCAVFLMPISNDLKSVQLSDSVRDTKLTEKVPVFSLETIVKLIEDNEHTERVQSFNSVNLLDAVVVPSFDAKSGTRSRRTKRETIVNHACPEGKVWFANRCRTYEEYERLKNDDEE